MSQITADQIRRVLDQYVAICESPANQRNRQFWTNAGEPWLIERWRGVSARKTNPPFTMALDIAGYSTVLGIECPAYYESAEAQLYGQMRYHLWEAEYRALGDCWGRDYRCICIFYSELSSIAAAPAVKLP